jgi:hypothetical protein
MLLHVEISDRSSLQQLLLVFRIGRRQKRFLEKEREGLPDDPGDIPPVIGIGAVNGNGIGFHDNTSWGKDMKRPGLTCSSGGKEKRCRFFGCLFTENRSGTDAFILFAFDICILGQ